MKNCGKCGQSRPLNMFYFKDSTQKYSSSCKICLRRRALMRHHALKNGEYVSRREINWSNPFRPERDRTKDFFPDILFSGDCA
jgi:hypothetical protein